MKAAVRQRILFKRKVSLELPFDHINDIYFLTLWKNRLNNTRKQLAGQRETKNYEQEDGAEIQSTKSRCYMSRKKINTKDEEADVINLQVRIIRRGSKRIIVGYVDNKYISYIIYPKLFSQATLFSFFS